MRLRRLHSIGLRLVSTAVFLLVLGGSPHVAAAQMLSPGCQFLNTPDTGLDGLYIAATAFGSFSAGEQVRVTAGPPEGQLGTTQEVTLEVNSVLVASVTYPGTLSYPIPRDGSYVVRWRADSQGVTWDVQCTEGRSPTPTTQEQCKDSGYLSFIDPRTGKPFKNQGQCIQYVNTGK